jgi:hypothetical protein
MPAVLILADQATSIRRAEEAALAMGGRVIATERLDCGIARLEDLTVPDVILIEIDHDGGAALDQLLSYVNALAHRDQILAVASVYPAMIDAVAARFDSPCTTILCKPNAADRIAALTIAWQSRHHSVHDRAGVADTLRLQHLSEEVARIARTLTALSVNDDDRQGRTGGFSDAMIGYAAEPIFVEAHPVSASEVRATIRLRRLRDQFFTGEMFADPAWDILLDLMAARLERAQVAVSSLCIAAAVPATTALRYIRSMTDTGILMRVADPTDGRRVFIELSDTAANGMTKYLVAAKKAGGFIV